MAVESERFQDAATASGDQLEVHLAILAKRPWIQLSILSALVAGEGFVDHSRFGFWSAVVLLAFLVVIVIVQIAWTVSKNRAGPVMVLNPAGVTVGDYPPVRWSDIDRIVVRPMAAGFFPATLMWGSVVAFVPKPGVAMPPPPGGRSVSAAQQAAWQQARLQRYGTNLTVVAALMSVSTDELVEAAERFGHVPVMRLRRPKHGEH